MALSLTAFPFKSNTNPKLFVFASHLNHFVMLSFEHTGGWAKWAYFSDIPKCFLMKIIKGTINLRYTFSVHWRIYTWPGLNVLTYTDSVWYCPWRHDVIKWKHFPRYWPFVRGIYWSPVNSPHKGQWRGTLMFSLICVWINGRVNNREAGDLRRYRVHYDFTVMLI